MHYRKRLTSVCLGLCLISDAQDFSNKGKDFWVGYGYHVRYVSGSPVNGQEMVLYFATEAITNVKVEIPSLGYVQNYTIPANTIFTTNPLPKSGGQDARLNAEGVSAKGIHITSDKPIVAYTHIYNQNVSGATLLFPTNTLGKEYYSINYEQRSNEPNSNAFFYAIAVDTGITTIEVVPTASTQTMTAGGTYTFTLQQGQVFNALGTVTGNNGVDLTGTRIRSISSSGGKCKRIAVFSGSGKIFINCGIAGNNSSDNYMVQAFPKNAWGKRYATVPTASMPNNIFRIAVSDPTTVVKLNGTPIPTSNLVNNFYYQFGSAVHNYIEADKPIMVAQYITTANICQNTAIGTSGDPEVIYLSPIEQSIDKVILNSTPNFAITEHHINVVIPNKGTGISSFRIDGNPTSASFITHPQNPSYSYAILNVGAGQHTLQSDSGFNAIAYGYGQAESYGYNAGANVKDLYQFISVQNQYATVNFPASCKGSPFLFSMTFPYQPTEIKWIFNGLFPDVTVPTPAFDSTWFVNGRQLYRYKLLTPYTINTIGTYPIKVIAQNPTPEGCSGEQEIDFDLQVYERPVADFNFVNNGCITDSVRFTDNSNANGRSINSWSWNFDDGAVSTLKSPAHLFKTSGSFNVQFSIITDVGCLSDTAKKVVVLNELPIAKFSKTSPLCVNQNIIFTDESTSRNATLVKWYWNFGDGTIRTVNTNAAQTHNYVNAGIYNVSLQVETSTGCKSIIYSETIAINIKPVASFNFGNGCLPTGTVQFTNSSAITTGSPLTYLWNFGDGNTSTALTPTNNYSSTGPFTISLIATAATGCSDDTVRIVNSIYQQPQASFTAPAEVCLGNAATFTDGSTAANSTIAQWQWNFGDGKTSATQNPSHVYSAAGTYTVTLSTVSAIGCVSTIATKSIVVNPLPTINFSVSNPNCVTNDLTFTDASTANAGSISKWTWNFDDGSSMLIKNNSNPFTYNYTDTGTFSVSLMVETSKGCNATGIKNITIHPLPVANFILPKSCLDDPFSQFTDSSTITDGSESSFSYVWNFGDPNANASNPNTSTQKNPSHKYIKTGNYNATFTVTSNNGCVSTIQKQFTVNGAVPQSAFIVQGGSDHCSDADVTVVNNSIVDVGNIVRLEIFWDTNDPNMKTIDDNPTPGETYSFRYPEFFTPSSKDVIVKVVAYSGATCLSSTTQKISVKARPQLEFDALTNVCADVPAFQITETQLVNNLPGSGVFSGNGVSSTGMFSPANAKAGNHTIRYTYTSTDGCSRFKEQNITVFPLPIVDAGPDRFMLEGGSIQLLANASGTALQYLWSSANSLDNADIIRPTASPATDQTYRFTVTTGNNCVAFDEVFVKVLKAPVIPNAFSPNGDGTHDRWEITSLESYPGATVEVYNRYGQLVFRSVGYDTPWDGKYKAKELPIGTYYYIINPKNGRKQVSGFVDIIR